MPLPTVILPGYLAPAKDYRDLEQDLNTMGIPTVTVPLQRRDWWVTLGGRPVTPILQALDQTIRQVLQDTQASHVNLIGHSAGGWISRIYLGHEPYGDRTWGGCDRVKTLVTLGTPHTSQERWTQRNLNFVNDTYPGAFYPSVRYLCVAGKAIYGQPSLRPDQWFSYQSYRLTCGEGACWGDGVTPLAAAQLAGAINLVLDAVQHSPRPGQRNDKDIQHQWYGSLEVAKIWAAHLL